MNGNDKFLNINDAHLRVTGGNVHASSFNLDQISIVTTSTTASTIDFLNETKAFTARSNIEVGTANLFVNTETSNVGIRTDAPEYALDVHGPANVSVLTANTVTGLQGTLLLGSHLLPTQHEQFDLGSADKKIRHLFLSDNSLWIGDESKISVVGGKMKFLKRNKNIVPSGTEALGGNATAAKTHAGVSEITDMKLEHWLAYTKTLTNGADKDIKDIFTDATANYEATSASDAFKEHGNDIYSVNKLRLGSAAAADATLDVVGTIKATSDLTVNTNTFHVDATNSRVGVGTTAPTTALDVVGTVTATSFSGSGSALTALNAANIGSGTLPVARGGTGTTTSTGTGSVVLSATPAFTGDATFDTNTLKIDAANNRVGIGETSPETKLHIKNETDSTGTGDAFITGLTANASNRKPTECLRLQGQWRSPGSGSLLRFTNYHGGATNPNTYEYNTAGIAGFDYANQWGGGLCLYTSPNTSGGGDLTPRMIIDSSGNVGIGTTSPYAKFQVNGQAGSLAASSASSFNTWVNSGNYQTHNNFAISEVSIHASHDIVSGSYIASHRSNITASDERIKKDIIDAEDGPALETLRLLKPKRYKYKDVVRRGSEPVWGFIAQEVRETLPYATQLRQDSIPNIYEMVNVSESNVLTFTNFDTSTLESNAMVLKVFDKDDTEHLINIAEVIDDKSLRIEEDLSKWTKLFVYGQQVDDFVFLQKDSIWTVATSALQEVDRQLQAEKAKVTTLESQLASVLTRLDALENA